MEWNKLSIKIENYYNSSRIFFNIYLLLYSTNLADTKLDFSSHNRLCIIKKVFIERSSICWWYFWSYLSSLYFYRSIDNGVSWCPKTSKFIF